MRALRLLAGASIGARRGARDPRGAPPGLYWDGAPVDCHPPVRWRELDHADRIRDGRRAIAECEAMVEDLAGFVRTPDPSRLDAPEGAR